MYFLDAIDGCAQHWQEYALQLHGSLRTRASTAPGRGRDLALVPAAEGATSTQSGCHQQQSSMIDDLRPSACAEGCYAI